MQTKGGCPGFPRNAHRRHVRSPVDVSTVLRGTRPVDVFPRDPQLGKLQGLDDQLAVRVLLQQFTVPMKRRALFERGMLKLKSFVLVTAARQNEESRSVWCDVTPERVCVCVCVRREECI